MLMSVHPKVDLHAIRKHRHPCWFCPVLSSIPRIVEYTALLLYIFSTQYPSSMHIETAPHAHEFTNTINSHSNDAAPCRIINGGYAQQPPLTPNDNQHPHGALPTDLNATSRDCIALPGKLRSGLVGTFRMCVSRLMATGRGFQNSSLALSSSVEGTFSSSSLSNWTTSSPATPRNDLMTSRTSILASLRRSLLRRAASLPTLQRNPAFHEQPLPFRRSPIRCSYPLLQRFVRHEAAVIAGTRFEQGIRSTANR